MKQKLTLGYSNHEFETMKTKKEVFIKNHKFKNLSWEDFIKILIFDSKWKN
jgi:hypothetical protein